MNTKSDWQAVHEQLLAEQRRKLGAPPTAEKLVAYTRGELSPEEEEHVRELLVAYPELAGSVAEPFPFEGAEPGDPDYLTEDELAEHWSAVEQRVRTPKDRRVLPFWRATAALAAALALVFGGLLWRAERELREPRVTGEGQVLEPADGRRGVGDASATVAANGDIFVLLLTTMHHSTFNQFRVEIVDENPTPHSLWRSGPLQRGADEVLAVVIPHKYLDPGKYQVVLFGIEGSREERLAGYSVRVPGR